MRLHRHSLFIGDAAMRVNELQCFSSNLLSLDVFWQNALYLFQSVLAGPIILEILHGTFHLIHSF